VANCFATDQRSAFVEACLGDCCRQRQSIQIPSRQRRNPIRVQITAVSSVSFAYSKQLQSKYVKRMETNRCGIKRIGCVSKANTSKGWKRIDYGIKRVGCVSAAYPKRIRQRDGNEPLRYQAYRLRVSCVSTVRSGSTRQTDRQTSV
jgi:hypothetical protein